jgi:hypothetical protein
MTVTSFARHCAPGAAAILALLVASAPAQAALTFNFSFTAGTSAAAQSAFIAAGSRWSNLFSDNVTVDLTVGTAVLGAGILGQAQSRELNYSYSAFRSAMVADSSSAADAMAVANLPGGNSFNMLLNGTSNSPNGFGSATPFVDKDNDANNSSIALTAANAKALGLAAGTGNLGGSCASTCDAFIQFNSNFAFDYDPSNGIGAGSYDFVGVATHEIGHALGFVSGVDVLDYNFGPFRDDQFTFVSALDMFRYSALSDANGVIDWTADTRAKYFSIDGGATAIAGFSTGSSHGDGSQASHWKDNLGLGVMDPTAAPGEILVVSDNDKIAMDVIGWNRQRQSSVVPEPASWMMIILGFGLVGHALRRRPMTVRFAGKGPADALRLCTARCSCKGAPQARLLCRAPL